jgi:hypothetical protein
LSAQAASRKADQLMASLRTRRGKAFALGASSALAAILVVVGVAVSVASGSPVKIDDVSCDFFRNGTGQAIVSYHNTSDHLVAIDLRVHAERNGDTYVDSTTVWDIAPKASGVMDPEFDSKPVGDAGYPDCTAEAAAHED